MGQQPELPATAQSKVTCVNSSPKPSESEKVHELACIQIGDVDDGLDQIIKQLMFQEEDGCSLYEDLSDISTN